MGHELDQRRRVRLLEQRSVNAMHAYNISRISAAYPTLTPSVVQALGMDGMSVDDPMLAWLANTDLQQQAEDMALMTPAALEMMPREMIDTILADNEMRADALAAAGVNLDDSRPGWLREAYQKVTDPLLDQWHKYAFLVGDFSQENVFSWSAYVAERMSRKGDNFLEAAGVGRLFDEPLGWLGANSPLVAAPALAALVTGNADMVKNFDQDTTWGQVLGIEPSAWGKDYQAWRAARTTGLELNAEAMRQPQWQNARRNWTGDRNLNMGRQFFTPESELSEETLFRLNVLGEAPEAAIENPGQYELGYPVTLMANKTYNARPLVDNYGVEAPSSIGNSMAYILGGRDFSTYGYKIASGALEFATAAASDPGIVTGSARAVLTSGARRILGGTARLTRSQAAARAAVRSIDDLAPEVDDAVRALSELDRSYVDFLGDKFDTIDDIAVNNSVAPNTLSRERAVSYIGETLGYAGPERAIAEATLDRLSGWEDLRRARLMDQATAADATNSLREAMRLGMTMQEYLATQPGRRALGLLASTRSPTLVGEVLQRAMPYYNHQVIQHITYLDDVDEIADFLIDLSDAGMITQTFSPISLTGSIAAKVSQRVLADGPLERAAAAIADKYSPAAVSRALGGHLGMLGGRGNKATWQVAGQIGAVRGVFSGLGFRLTQSVGKPAGYLSRLFSPLAHSIDPNNPEKAADAFMSYWRSMGLSMEQRDELFTEMVNSFEFVTKGAMSPVMNRLVPGWFNERLAGATTTLDDVVAKANRAFAENLGGRAGMAQEAVDELTDKLTRIWRDSDDIQQYFVNLVGDPLFTPGKRVILNVGRGRKVAPSAHDIVEAQARQIPLIAPKNLRRMIRRTSWMGMHGEEAGERLLRWVDEEIKGLEEVKAAYVDIAKRAGVAKEIRVTHDPSNLSITAKRALEEAGFDVDNYSDLRDFLIDRKNKAALGKTDLPKTEAEELMEEATVALSSDGKTIVGKIGEAIAADPVSKIMWGNSGEALASIYEGTLRAQNAIWKPLVMIRPAYIVRVLGEEQMRMWMHGRRSMLNSPISFLALAVSHYKPESNRWMFGSRHLTEWMDDFLKGPVKRAVGTEQDINIMGEAIADASAAFRASQYQGRSNSWNRGEYSVYSGEMKLVTFKRGADGRVSTEYLSGLGYELLSRAEDPIHRLAARAAVVDMIYARGGADAAREALDKYEDLRTIIEWAEDRLGKEWGEDATTTRALLADVFASPQHVGDGRLSYINPLWKYRTQLAGINKKSRILLEPGAAYEYMQSVHARNGFLSGQNWVTRHVDGRIVDGNGRDIRNLGVFDERQIRDIEQRFNANPNQEMYLKVHQSNGPVNVVPMEDMPNTPTVAAAQEVDTVGVRNRVIVTPSTPIEGRPAFELSWVDPNNQRIKRAVVTTEPHRLRIERETVSPNEYDNIEVDFTVTADLDGPEGWAIRDENGRNVTGRHYTSERGAREALERIVQGGLNEPPEPLKMKFVSGNPMDRGWERDVTLEPMIEDKTILFHGDQYGSSFMDGVRADGNLAWSEVAPSGTAGFSQSVERSASYAYSHGWERSSEEVGRVFVYDLDDFPEPIRQYLLGPNTEGGEIETVVDTIRKVIEKEFPGVVSRPDFQDAWRTGNWTKIEGAVLQAGYSDQLMDLGERMGIDMTARRRSRMIVNDEPWRDGVLGDIVGAFSAELSMPNASPRDFPTLRQALRKIERGNPHDVQEGMEEVVNILAAVNDLRTGRVLPEADPNFTVDSHIIEPFETKVDEILDMDIEALPDNGAGVLTDSGSAQVLDIREMVNDRIALTRAAGVPQREVLSILGEYEVTDWRNELINNWGLDESVVDELEVRMLGMGYALTEEEVFPAGQFRWMRRVFEEARKANQNAINARALDLLDDDVAFNRWAEIFGDGMDTTPDGVPRPDEWANITNMLMVIGRTEGKDQVWGGWAAGAFYQMLPEGVRSKFETYFIDTVDMTDATGNLTATSQQVFEWARANLDDAEMAQFMDAARHFGRLALMSDLNFDIVTSTGRTSASTFPSGESPIPPTRSWTSTETHRPLPEQIKTKERVKDFHRQLVGLMPESAIANMTVAEAAQYWRRAFNGAVDPTPESLAELQFTPLDINRGQGKRAADEMLKKTQEAVEFADNLWYEATRVRPMGYIPAEGTRSLFEFRQAGQNGVTAAERMGEVVEVDVHPLEYDAEGFFPGATLGGRLASIDELDITMADTMLLGQTLRDVIGRVTRANVDPRIALSAEEILDLSINGTSLRNWLVSAGITPEPMTLRQIVGGDDFARRGTARVANHRMPQSTETVLEYIIRHADQIDDEEVRELVKHIGVMNRTLERANSVFDGGYATGTAEEGMRAGIYRNAVEEAYPLQRVEAGHYEVTYTAVQPPRTEQSVQDWEGVLGDFADDSLGEVIDPSVQNVLALQRPGTTRNVPLDDYSPYRVKVTIRKEGKAWKVTYDAPDRNLRIDGVDLDTERSYPTLKQAQGAVRERMIGDLFEEAPEYRPTSGSMMNFDPIQEPRVNMSKQQMEVAFEQIQQKVGRTQWTDAEEVLDALDRRSSSLLSSAVERQPGFTEGTGKPMPVSARPRRLNNPERGGALFEQLPDQPGSEDLMRFIAEGKAERAVLDDLGEQVLDDMGNPVTETVVDVDEYSRAYSDAQMSEIENRFGEYLRPIVDSEFNPTKDTNPLDPTSGRSGPGPAEVRIPNREKSPEMNNWNRFWTQMSHIITAVPANMLTRGPVWRESYLRAIGLLYGYANPDVRQHLIRHFDEHGLITSSTDFGFFAQRVEDVWSQRQIAKATASGDQTLAAVRQAERERMLTGRLSKMDPAKRVEFLTRDIAPPEQGGIASLEELNRMAEMLATQEVGKILFDATQRNNFFDQFAILFPFGDAWAEVLTRWFKLLTEPGGVGQRNRHRMANLHHSLQGGMYKDQYYENEGAMVYTDEYGEQRLLMPWSPWMNRMLAQNGSERIRQGVALNNLNPVSLAMIPGLGPVASIAAGLVFGDTLLDPLKHPFVRDYLFPYGVYDAETEGFSGMAERLIGIPGWAKKIFTGAISTWRGYEADRVMEDKYGRMVGAVLKWGFTTGRYTGGTRAEQEDQLRQASGIAAVLLLAEGMGQFLISSPNTQLEIGNLDGGEVDSTIDFEGVIGWSQRYYDVVDAFNGDYDSAVAYWLERFPNLNPEAVQLSMSLRTQPSPVTARARLFQQEHPELYERFDLAAYYLHPDGMDDEFVFESLADAYNEGERVRLTPRDMQIRRDRAAALRAMHLWDLESEWRYEQGWITREQQSQERNVYVNEVITREFPLWAENMKSQTFDKEDAINQIDQMVGTLGRPGAIDPDEYEMGPTLLLMNHMWQSAGNLSRMYSPNGSDTWWLESPNEQAANMREKVVQFVVELVDRNPMAQVVWNEVYAPVFNDEQFRARLGNEPDDWGGQYFLSQANDDEMIDERLGEEDELVGYIPSRGLAP